jgi:hypothetical protein
MIWLMNISSGNYIIQRSAGGGTDFAQFYVKESQRQHSQSPCCRTHSTWYSIETCNEYTGIMIWIGRYNTNVYIECSHQKKMSCENWESTMMSYHTSATTAATFSLGTIKNRSCGWWNRWSIPFTYGTIYPSSSSSSYHQFMFEYHTEMMANIHRLMCELNQRVHPNRSYSKSTQRNSSRCATTRECYVQFHGNSKGASICTLGAKSLLVGNFHMKLILLQSNTVLRKLSGSKMDEYHMFCTLFCSVAASFHSPTVSFFVTVRQTSPCDR